MRMLLAAVLLLNSALLYSQQITVSGVVTSATDNVPLPGVSVSVKGTKRGTQTNTSGYFTLSAAKGEVLQFSMVGYTTQSVTIGDASTFTIKLASSEKQLGEVVVTAYGMKRAKRELSYQAPVVKGEDIAQTRRENFLNSLAGRVPGLTVTSTSGTPGGSAQVILRGAVSIAGNAQPLFIIDGVPVSNSTLAQGDNLLNPSNVAATPGSAGFANRNVDYNNRMSDINPEDIQDVTILKGPEATALYGSDGASGAIIITTKKGTAGRTNVTYDNSFRWDKVYRFPEIQTTYARGFNGVYDPTAYNTGAVALTNGFLMFGPKYPDGTQTYDNLHSFFQTGFSQQYNVSVESGAQNLTYRFSAGYLKQTGVVPTTSYERLSLRLTGSANIAKGLNLSSSWAYIPSTTHKSSKGQGGYYLNLINWPIDDDISQYINPDGSRRALRGAAGYSNELDNPFWDVYKNPQVDQTDRLTGNVVLNYDPANWINLNAAMGVDHFITDGSYVTNPQSKYGFPVNGFISIYTQNFRDINGTFRTTLKKTFDGKYSNSLTLGFFFEDSKSEINAQKGERFYEPNFISINNTDPTSQGAKVSNQNIRKVRFFGNYTFGYNNILYLTLGGSYEGVSTLSSAFFDKQPFFGYGAASGAFVFSDLGMFKTMDWLSFGKLRVSYATTGKAPYAAYVIDKRFVPQVTTGGGFILDVTGGNTALKPEFSQNLEIGAELKFLKNRLGIDFAWYQINSKDQIITNRLSYGTGYVLQWINGGLVSNKGVEIQLTGTPILKNNFSWNITLNFDHNKGIVKRLPADLPLYYDSDTWLAGNLRSQVSAGTSIYNLAAYTLQRNNAGQLLISPTTGLPLKDNNFRNVGDRNPDFKLGIINAFTMKNWTLSFNVDIRRGGDVFNGNEMYMVQTGVSKKTLDRETPRVIDGVLADGLENTDHPTKNTISITPYFRNDFYSAMYTEADFVESVNWVRLRDATLAYQLPKSLLARQRLIKNASLFVTGTDLFLITNYSGIDPNVNGTNASGRGIGGAGIDFGSVPTARGVSGGFKVNF